VKKLSLGNWSTGGKSVEQGGYALSKRPAKKSSAPKEFGKSNKGMTFSKGGEMKESKAMMKKELSFMKKKGAPKSMVRHEMAEAGMEAGGIPKRLPNPKQMGNMGMKAGGLAMGHKTADGVAMKGKTKGSMVKMATGGMAMVNKGGKMVPAFAADGKGKMAKGGMAKRYC
jgi:hypothetical protein